MPSCHRGDQHDSSMVEYFLTENLLAHFNQILQQRSNRRGNVAMQVGDEVQAWRVQPGSDTALFELPTKAERETGAGVRHCNPPADCVTALPFKLPHGPLATAARRCCKR